MMEKYITNLLELNNRVIVPDLGAFIIRQQDPKELVFNDLLAFDDGMITERLIQEENLSKAEAQARIKQFVEKVKKVLQKGDDYSLENLGTLTMDASSRINFVAEETTGKEPAKASGKIDVAAEEPAKEATELPLEEVPETDEEVPEADEAVTESPGEEAEPEPQAEEVPETDEEVTEPLVKEVAEAPEEQVPVADKEAEEAPAEEVPEAEEEEVTESLVEEVAEAPEEEVPEADEEVAETPEIPEKEVPEEAEAVEESPEKETDTEEMVKEASEHKIPIEGDDGGFILDEGESDVEVDATGEDTPLEPDGEEPPFQIDDGEDDKVEADEDKEDEIPDRFRGVMAEEFTEDATLTDEEILASQEELYKLKVEGRPVTLEPDEHSFSGYGEPSYRRRRAWPWILGSVGLILVLIVAGWFIFPESISRFLPEKLTQGLLEDEPDFSSGKFEQPVTGEATEESGEAEEFGEEPAESPGMTEEDEPEYQEPVPDVQPSGKKYYVVAGCFADIRNAENYVRTLRQKGFDASIFGKRDNLHAVCFSAHTSRQAAAEELSRIRDTFDPSAWVLYY